MGKFLLDLVRSVLSSVLVVVILFIGTYSLITHEFPPNWHKMKAAWTKLDQLASLGGSEEMAKTGPFPPQLQQVAENLMKGPEKMEKMEKEMSDLRERVRALEQQQHKRTHQ